MRACVYSRRGLLLMPAVCIRSYSCMLKSTPAHPLFVPALWNLIAPFLPVGIGVAAIIVSLLYGQFDPSLSMQR